MKIEKNTKDDLHPPKAMLDTFGLKESEFWVLYDIFAPHIPRWANDIEQTKHELGMMLCQLARMPHENSHQQPYDFIRQFPLSLSPDRYETQDDFEVVVILFVLWAAQCIEYLKDPDIDSALLDIEWLSVCIARSYGDSNNTVMRIELSDALGWVRWFRCTHNCFDMDTGGLADPDTAALRDFMMRRKWGRA